MEKLLRAFGSKFVSKIAMKLNIKGCFALVGHFVRVQSLTYYKFVLLSTVLAPSYEIFVALFRHYFVIYNAQQQWFI